MTQGPTGRFIKLLSTGFCPSKSVSSAIDEIICAFNDGVLSDDENCYTVKTMQRLKVGS